MLTRTLLVLAMAVAKGLAEHYGYFVYVIFTDSFKLRLLWASTCGLKN